MPGASGRNAEVLLQAGGLIVYVNRWSIVARAKQPYVEWANSFDDGGPTMDLESKRTHATIYLFNALEGVPLDDMVREFFWQAIFDIELVNWMRDMSTWPANRTVEMFYEWFDVELITELVDLGKGRIKSK